jgi:HNH endonuclease
MEGTLPHPNVTMNRRRTYDPVGYCIYCGASGPEDDLSKEHIIPKGLGGALVLGKSSCFRCRKRTGAVEEHVLRIMFGNVRAQLGVKTRRPEKRPTHTRLTRNHGLYAKTIVQVPLTEIPPIIVMPRWLPAGVLMDESPFDERGAQEFPSHIRTKTYPRCNA